MKHSVAIVCLAPFQQSSTNFGLQSPKQQDVESPKKTLRGYSDLRLSSSSRSFSSLLVGSSRRLWPRTARHSSCESRLDFNNNLPSDQQTYETERTPDKKNDRNSNNGKIPHAKKPCSKKPKGSQSVWSNEIVLTSPAVPNRRYVPTPAECPIEISIKDSNIFQFYPSTQLPSYSNLRICRSHLASVNYRTRIPDWVAERITVPGVRGSGDRSSSNFFIDVSVPALWRSTNEDFKYSGYERGHLAAAASHRNDQDVINATFCLSSNIIPQSKSSNVGAWSTVERISRSLAFRYHNVYVISGPLWISDQQFRNSMLPIEQHKLLSQDGSSRSQDGSSKQNRRQLTTDTHLELSDSKSFEGNCIEKMTSGSAGAREDGLSKNVGIFHFFSSRSRESILTVQNWIDRLRRYLNREERKTKLVKNHEVTYATIGTHCVAVPTHLFKIILAVNPRRVSGEDVGNEKIDPLPLVMIETFVVPNNKNREKSINSLQRSVRFVEFYSGLDFSGLMEFASSACLAELGRRSAEGKIPRDISSIIGDGSQMPKLIKEVDNIPTIS